MRLGSTESRLINPYTILTYYGFMTVLLLGIWSLDILPLHIVNVSLPKQVIQIIEELPELLALISVSIMINFVVISELDSEATLKGIAGLLAAFSGFFAVQIAFLDLNLPPRILATIILLPLIICSGHILINGALVRFKKS